MGPRGACCQPPWVCVELGKLWENIAAPCARGGLIGLRPRHPAQGSHAAWLRSFGWAVPLARRIVEREQVVQTGSSGAAWEGA